MGRSVFHQNFIKTDSGLDLASKLYFAQPFFWNILHWRKTGQWKVRTNPKNPWASYLTSLCLGSSSVQNLLYRVVVSKQVCMCTALRRVPGTQQTLKSLPLTLCQPLSPLLEAGWQAKQSPCSLETSILVQQVRHRDNQICKMSRSDKG